MAKHEDFKLEMKFSVDDLYTMNTGHLLICKEMFDEAQRALERGKEMPSPKEMRERTITLNRAVEKIYMLRRLIDYVNDGMAGILKDKKSVKLVGKDGAETIKIMKDLSNQFFEIFDMFINDITAIQEKAEEVQDGFDKKLDEMLGDLEVGLNEEDDG